MDEDETDVLVDLGERLDEIASDLDLEVSVEETEEHQA
jgi:hypothetical protein